jgi:alkyl hydroperoxide reductase subunit AhpF
MSIISEKDRKALIAHLETELKDDVTVKLFTQTASLTIPGRECEYCEPTKQLMEEITSASSKLHLEVYDFYSQPEVARAHGVERVPAIVMGNNGYNNLKFYGMPMGNEFGTILDDLVALSHKETHFKEELRDKIREIDQDVSIQVFVTPT